MTPRNLEQLRAVLGRWRSVQVNEAAEYPVIAAWECGCRAAGDEWGALTLQPCAQHARLFRENDSTPSPP